MISETKLNIPIIRIEPARGWVSLKLGEIWPYRELLYFLVWRDVKVRYKQTAIGAAWAIIQPLLTMVIFTLVFDKFAKVPSNGLPYPIFSFAALLPWTYFSKALNQSILSVVSNANLITKVYFPRLLLPTASVLAGMVDFAISFLFFVILMVWYGIIPSSAVLFLPGFTLLAMLTALAVSLWLAVINVRYRDVGQAIPFVVQLWMFASPVAYPMSVVPEKWRLFYSLNPMAGVIEGFRWALTGSERPPLVPIILSTLIVCVLLYSGILFFRRMESTFADEI